MPKRPFRAKKSQRVQGLGDFFVVGRDMFSMLERDTEVPNAIQSPKLVDYDLTKDSRHLSSCQMTHVLNSIAKQWQILVHFSSFAMSIWRLFLGQFWYEQTRCRRTDGMVTPKNLSQVHQMTTKWLSTCGASLMLLQKPNNTVRFGLKLLVTEGQGDKCK